jgi:predicted  nucleic acid-binding Zn-ribbon protein
VIIQTQDRATELREEYTKVKEVSDSKIEEYRETITNLNKQTEVINKTITDTQTKISDYRSKEKVIENKITSTTDTSE